MRVYFARDSKRFDASPSIEYSILIPFIGRTLAIEETKLDIFGCSKRKHRRE